MTTPEKSPKNQHLPTHLRATRTFFEGRLYEPFQLKLGDIIAVHILDDEEKEVYSQLYLITKQPYRDYKQDGIWFVEVRQGPTGQPATSTGQEEDFSEEVRLITLQELGMRQERHNGVKVWQNRYTTNSHLTHPLIILPLCRHSAALSPLRA